MPKKYVKRFGLAVIMILATLLFFSVDVKTVLAQEGPVQTGQFRKKLESVITEAEEELPQEIDSYFRYMPSREVDAQSGKVGIIDTDTEYSYEFKLFDKLPVEFSLGHQYTSIENSTSVELPAHLVGLSTGIETTFPFFRFNKTYLCVAIKPSFFADNWDFHSSSLRIPVQTFLIYQPDTKWTFIGGVAVYPDFEDAIWPIIGFIYKPNDKLTFNITPKRPNISYKFNDKFTLFAEGASSYCEFEVSKDNLKNVVLKYREMHLGAGMKYKVNKFIHTSISAGAIFNRSLKYRDSLGKVNIKNGLYTEFRVEIEM